MSESTSAAIGEYWVLGHRVKPVHTIGDWGLVEIVSLPGVPGPPPHHHVEASEFFYVVDGTLDVCVNGTWQTLATRDSLCLPPGTVHTLMNRGKRNVAWLTAWSPRGFEKFFTDFGVPVATEGAFERSTSQAAIQRVAAECAGYGMIIQKE